MPYKIEIPGWMTINDLRTIELLAKKAPVGGCVVELGSFCGRSAAAWALSCDPTTRITCVDIWPKGFWSCPPESYKVLDPPLPYEHGDKNFDQLNEFRKNTSEFKNINIICKNSVDDDLWTGGPIDILFIDEDHSFSGTQRALNYWAPFVREGGLICGHDWGPDFQGLVDAVKAYTTPRNLSVILFEFSSVWMISTDKRSKKLSDQTISWGTWTDSAFDIDKLLLK